MAPTETVPAPEPTAPRAELLGVRLRWVAFALVAVLVATPFLAVTFPPITDLPQQTAQIRLAADALTNPESPYRIQWWTPYTLSYLAIAFGWLVAGPLAAGRIGMMLIALVWVGAAHLLAARRGRSTAAAVLASSLVFNGVLYWGFFSFAVGWPAFVVWLLATLEPPRSDRPWREAGKFFVLSALLYACHALWLAAGGLWLGVWTLIGLARGRGLRAALPRFAGMVPVLAGSAVWFARIARTNFATPPAYFQNPLSRFSVEWFRGALYGGLRGHLEELFMVVLLAWFLASVLTNGGRLFAATDRALALAGALFVVVALTVPDEYTNTIQFDERWMPGAMTLLLLAAPTPRLRWGRALTPAALVGLALFTGATTLVWRQFEREDMSGLAAALAELPDQPRVLGLALDRTSRWIDGLPFLQTFAYSQVVHGGVLNFSFAEFPPSLVVYRRPPEKPWAPGLEWLPHRLRIRDFQYFDYVLLGADRATQERFSSDPLLATATADGHWRLYRVNHPAVQSALAARGIDRAPALGTEDPPRPR